MRENYLGQNHNNQHFVEKERKRRVKLGLKIQFYNGRESGCINVRYQGLFLKCK